MLPYLPAFCLYQQIASGKDARVLDVPYMMFGGKYPLANGDTLHLRNAFEEAFAVPLLRSAREKCGYCPASRNALKHPKCRREEGVDLEEGMYNAIPQTIEELEENIRKFHDDILHRGNDSTDYYTEMIRKLEEMNKISCQELVNLGFEGAELAKKIASESRERAGLPSTTTTSTTTHPAGSRARQDQMQMARYPGEFFNITSGGLRSIVMICLLLLHGKHSKRK